VVVAHLHLGLELAARGHVEADPVQLGDVHLERVALLAAAEHDRAGPGLERHHVERRAAADAVAAALADREVLGARVRP